MSAGDAGACGAGQLGLAVDLGWYAASRRSVSSASSVSAASLARPTSSAARLSASSRRSITSSTISSRSDWRRAARRSRTGGSPARWRRRPAPESSRFWSRSARARTWSTSCSAFFCSRSMSLISVCAATSGVAQPAEALLELRRSRRARAASAAGGRAGRARRRAPAGRAGATGLQVLLSRLPSWSERSTRR